MRNFKAMPNSIDFYITCYSCLYYSSMKVSTSASDLPIPFVAVFYQASAIAEKEEVSTNEGNLNTLYF